METMMMKKEAVFFVKKNEGCERCFQSESRGRRKGVATRRLEDICAEGNVAAVTM